MAKVAIQKEWGFMLHPACMEVNREEFDPEMFQVVNKSERGSDIDGRICVACKGELRFGPANRR